MDFRQSWYDFSPTVSTYGISLSTATNHLTSLRATDARIAYNTVSATFSLLQTRLASTPASLYILSVYDCRTKENGFAKTDLNANLQQLEYGEHTYTSLCKADSANTFMVCKGNFAVPMNLWLVNDKWTQLSNINPQQADYAWGKNRELFQWKAFDGTPLDGVLYKPDNFDPNKKYPVIVYFYERQTVSHSTVTSVLRPAAASLTSLTL